MVIGPHPPPPRMQGAYTVKRSPQAQPGRKSYQAIWVDTREPMFYDRDKKDRGMRIYGDSPEHVRSMVGKYMAKYIADIPYRDSDSEELTTAYKSR